MGTDLQQNVLMSVAIMRALKLVASLALVSTVAFHLQPAPLNRPLSHSGGVPWKDIGIYWVKPGSTLSEIDRVLGMHVRENNIPLWFHSLPKETKLFKWVTSKIGPPSDVYYFSDGGEYHLVGGCLTAGDSVVAVGGESRGLCGGTEAKELLDLFGNAALTNDDLSVYYCKSPSSRFSRELLIIDFQSKPHDPTEFAWNFHLVWKDGVRGLGSN